MATFSAAASIVGGMEIFDNMGSVMQQAAGPQGHTRAVFPDVEKMKKNLRENILNKAPYDVSMYYKKRGFAQRVARHKIFENITLFVITFNALWLWVDADYNQAPILNKAPLVFQVVEFFFCFYFITEWTIRFMSFAAKRNGLKDPWFVFDSCLVIIMVIDTGIMYMLVALLNISSSGMANVSVVRLARLLRLLRMCRMVRLLHAMPEILILIKGMFAAMRSVFFTLCLLLILIYVFGVVFRQLCDQDDNPLRKQFFETVPKSMHTLLIYGCFMDGLGDLARKLQGYNFGLLLAFYCFLLLAALTLMNMLIGVLVEVVSAVAATEKEGMSIFYVQDRLRHMMSDGPRERSGFISKAQFLDLLHQPSAVKILQEVGVDAVGLIDFADFIFEEDLGSIDMMKMKSTGGSAESESPDQYGASSAKGYLSFKDFVEVVLSLRGDNYASVKDIVELRKYVRLCTDNAVEKMNKMLKKATGDRPLDSARKDFSELSSVPEYFSELSSVPESIQAPVESLSSCAGTRPEASVQFGVKAPLESLGQFAGDLTTLELPAYPPERNTTDFSQAAGEMFVQLVERHERELAQLRAENCRLRSLLERPGREPAGAASDLSELAEQSAAVVGQSKISVASKLLLVNEPLEKPSCDTSPLSQQPLLGNDGKIQSNASQGQDATGCGSLTASSARHSQLRAWCEARGTQSNAEHTGSGRVDTFRGNSPPVVYGAPVGEPSQKRLVL